MSQNVAIKEEKKEVVAPNPYNSNKEYTEGRSEVPRGLMGMNDGRSAPVNRGEAPTNDQATTETKPYESVDYKKRYDDLKRHYDEKIQEFKSREAELKNKANSNKPDYTPPKTPEQLATFRKEHPEIYEVAESVAHQRAQEELKELKSKMEKLEEEKTDALRSRAFAELKSLHPDFEEVRESQEFQRWAMQQSDEIQNWLFNNSTNAKLTARAIDLYKLDSGMMTKENITPPKRENVNQFEPSAADAVETRSLGDVGPVDKKLWTASEIRKMNVREYEQVKDLIWKAYNEGRVIANK